MAPEYAYLFPDEGTPVPAPISFLTEGSVFLAGQLGLVFGQQLRLSIDGHERLAEVGLVSRDPLGVLVVFQPRLAKQATTDADLISRRPVPRAPSIAWDEITSEHVIDEAKLSADSLRGETKTYDDGLDLEDPTNTGSEPIAEEAEPGAGALLPDLRHRRAPTVSEYPHDMADTFDAPMADLMQAVAPPSEPLTRLKAITEVGMPKTAPQTPLEEFDEYTDIPEPEKN